ncbi:MAG: hypothetical protein LUG26_00825, partial [Ruminococcus sp.]|nr:hypothetical protein [Ruminococcus sp.]
GSSFYHTSKITMDFLFQVFNFIMQSTKIKTTYPIEIYSMNEPVSLTDSVSYNMIEQPDYDIAVTDTRIIDADDYLEEMGKTSDDFNMLSERYFEITIDIVNNGDMENVFSLYGIPVLETNWYTFYDPDATVYINGFEDQSRNVCIKAKADGHRTLKVAYRLYWKDSNTEQWNDLENEEMWLSVTQSPIDQRIAIEVS